MALFLRIAFLIVLLPALTGCCGKYRKDNARLQAENGRLKSQFSRFTEETVSLQVQIGKLQQKIATMENEKIELTQKLEAKGHKKK